MYKILFKKSAVKELAKLPENEQINIIQKVNALKEEPYPSGIRKLLGQDDVFRIRIGNYRVIYIVHNNELIIEIIRIKHRKDVYRK